MRQLPKTLALASVLCLTLASVACKKEEPPQERVPDANLPADDPYSTGATELQGFDENGASLHRFTVSERESVRFSRGNLQYNATSGLWRFAPHQYDAIGTANADNLAPESEGWIDLFGWGTSGWNSRGTAQHYSPTSISGIFSSYAPGGDLGADLLGDYEHSDWGIHNAIANGGNREGMWRTLTRREWEYLIGRTGAEERVDKWGVGTVNGVRGLVLLPDQWTLPTGARFTPGAEGWSTNSYDESSWGTMEAAGALFLPVTGVRYYSTVDNASKVGCYWSVNHYNDDRAYNFYFDATSVDPANRNFRSNGLAVRLVMKN